MPRLEQRIRRLEKATRARADVSCPACHGMGGVLPIPFVEREKDEPNPDVPVCPTCGKLPKDGRIGIIVVIRPD
jgi:hypothetical protein